MERSKYLLEWQLTISDLLPREMLSNPMYSSSSSCKRLGGGVRILEVNHVSSSVMDGEEQDLRIVSLLRNACRLYNTKRAGEGGGGANRRLS